MMSEMQFQEDRHARTPAFPASSPGMKILLIAAAILIVLALFARVMTFELQRDEQFYVSASVLFPTFGLYDQLNFSHLPNLPILLSAFFSAIGTTHYLLAGRLIIFAAWLGSFAALWLFGQRYRLGLAATALLAALLVCNPILLDAAGMAVTNNFIATPFLLFGILAFLRGVEGTSPEAYSTFLAGFLLALGAGFKANYSLILVPIGIAALLMPHGASVATRLRKGFLPLVLGGVIGGLPTLYFLAQNPEGFLAHIVSLHRGPQIAYWLAHADLHDPKVMSLRDKLLMAHQIWLSGTTMLLPLLIITLAAIAAYFSPTKGLAWLGRFRTGPIILMASMVLIAMAASLLPTPSFPQYHSTPFLFAILLIGLMLHALEPSAQIRARPVIVAGLALAALSGGPVLLLSLAKLPSPGNWTGIVVHQDGEKLRSAIARAGASGPVATLLPVHALEGGLSIYPHLALGQFIYRASAYIPAGDRHNFANLVAPETLGELLTAHRPSAILVGGGNRLEEPLVRFARDNGYAAEKVELRQSEDNAAPLLLVAPPRR